MIQFDTQKAHLVSHQQALYEQKTAKRLARDAAWAALKANPTQATVDTVNKADAEASEASSQVAWLHAWNTGF